MDNKYQAYSRPKELQPTKPKNPDELQTTELAPPEMIVKGGKLTPNPQYLAPTPEIQANQLATETPVEVVRDDFADKMGILMGLMPEKVGKEVARALLTEAAQDAVLKELTIAAVSSMYRTQDNRILSLCKVATDCVISLPVSRFAFKMCNALVAKTGFNPLQAVNVWINRNTYTDFDALQLNKEFAELETQSFRKIVQFLCKYDQAYANYSKQNPLFASRDYQNANTVTSKTPILIAKILGIGVREKYADALRSDRFKTMLINLLKVQSNIATITEYGLENFYLSELDNINAQLDLILAGCRNLRILIPRILDNYSASEINSFISDIVAVYLANNDNMCGIKLDPENSSIKINTGLNGSIEKAFEDYKGFDETFKMDKDLLITYLYAYSLKITGNTEYEKELLIELAQVLKGCIQLQSVRSMISFLDSQILPLERKIKHIYLI